MKSKRLEISNFPDELRKKLNNRLEQKKSCGRQKGDVKEAVVEAVKQWLDTQGKVVLTIDIGQAQEVFEELCSIPTEHSIFHVDGIDRHPAIEAMIKQLSDILAEKEPTESNQSAEKFLTSELEKLGATFVDCTPKKEKK